MIVSWGTHVNYGYPQLYLILITAWGFVRRRRRSYERDMAYIHHMRTEHRRYNRQRRGPGVSFRLVMDDAPHNATKSVVVRETQITGRRYFDLTISE